VWRTQCVGEVPSGEPLLEHLGARHAADTRVILGAIGECASVEANFSEPAFDVIEMRELLLDRACPERPAAGFDRDIQRV